MSFGADSDIWGLGSDSAAPGWKLQASSKSPANEVADAEDSEGTIVESQIHSSVTSPTRTYVRTLDATIKLYDTATGVDYRVGKVIGGFVIRSLQLDTSKERPRLVIGGESCSIADSLVAKIPVTDLHIAGTRKAHKCGFTVAAGNKLLSSSITVEAQTSREWDSQSANTVAMDVMGGRVTATGNFVGVTAAPSATADAGWQVQAPSGDERDRAAYATGSITVFKNLAPA